MKKLIIMMFVFAVGYSSVAASDVFVRGYTRMDGTYVGPHWRSNPDGNPYNNRSYRQW